MLRTFFLSEIPLLNVRWKSLSVIYKMIQLVKTHDVSKLDSLFDRACCDPQQISQLKTVLRNTFTDITFWPLKIHKPPLKNFTREFPNTLLLSSLIHWENLFCRYFGLPYYQMFALPLLAQLQELEKQHQKKKRCKGRCSYVPDSREESF